MATLGAGIIILVVFWSISLLFLMAFCGSKGKLKTLGIIPTIISTLLTIILVSIPVGRTNINTGPSYTYSYIPLIWIFILTGLAFTLVVCLLLYLVTDVMEPHYAHVPKTPHVLN